MGDERVTASVCHFLSCHPLMVISVPIVIAFKTKSPRVAWNSLGRRAGLELLILLSVEIPINHGSRVVLSYQAPQITHSRHSLFLGHMQPAKSPMPRWCFITSWVRLTSSIADSCKSPMSSINTTCEESSSSCRYDGNLTGRH